MAKRIFAALCLATLVVCTASQAQVRSVTIDGCAKLARVIYSEVTASAMYGTGNAGPWVVDIGNGDIVLCEHAAKTVSNAFSLAMMSVGIQVQWPRSGISPGDTCDSHYLSQCYPDRAMRPGSMTTHEAQLVEQSWAVVSRAVMHEMYNPFSSDEVRFRDNDLKLRLGLSLRSVRSADEFRDEAAVIRGR